MEAESSNDDEPSTLSDQEISILNWHRGMHDSEENEETTPPPEEEIREQSLWVAECYPLSYVDKLIESLRRLGWVGPDSRPNSAEIDLEDWVQTSARTGRLGWVNVGWILRPTDQDRLLGRCYTAELPEQVDHACASLTCIMPGLFVFACQFILTADTSQLIHRALASSYETFTTPHKGGYRIHTPRFQKADQAKRTRDDVGDACCSWVAECLPGLFARSGRDKFPICEFFTLESGSPFRLGSRMNGLSYLSILGFDRSFSAWRCDALPGLMFAEPDPFERGRRRWVLASKRSQLYGDDQIRPYGGRTQEGLTNRLQVVFQDVMVRLALDSLMRVYQDEFTGLRSRVAVALSSGDPGNRVALLQSVEAQLFRFSGDALPITSELTEFCAAESWFVHGVPRFCSVQRPLKTDSHLLELLRQDLSHRCQRLREGEREMRDFIVSGASMANAITQEQLAKSNLHLQVAVVVLSGVLLVVAVIQLAIAFL